MKNLILSLVIFVFSFASFSQNQYGYGPSEDSTIVEIVSLFKSIDGQFITKNKLEIFYNESKKLNYTPTQILLCINEFQKSSTNVYGDSDNFLYENKILSDLNNKIINVNFDFTYVYSNDRSQFNTVFKVEVTYTDTNGASLINIIDFYISKGRISAVSYLSKFPNT